MVYKPFLEKPEFYKFRLYGLSAAIALMGISGWTVYQHLSSSRNVGVPSTLSKPLPPQSIAAVGRIEPQGSIIKLSVANARDSRVNQILVQEGEQVEAGQIIAILQGLEKQQASLVEAQKSIEVQEALLNQVRAGNSTASDRIAQQASIQRLEAQLQGAVRTEQANLEEAQVALERTQTEYERFKQLHQDGAVSASQLDDRRQAYTTDVAKVKSAQATLENQRETLKAQVVEARARLNRLDEVPLAAIQVSQAQLSLAKSQLSSMTATLEDYYVRAPIDGQILSINTQVGEQVNADQGVVDLAKTDQMYVVAEVYETDVPRVKAGQAATIISENGGFLGELKGRVEKVGLQIQKTDVLNTDPAADKNARVVEVKIRLDSADSQNVSGLTYMQVRTKIHLDGQDSVAHHSSI